MDANKKAMLRNIRQALVVTLVLLLLCGFVFPVLLSGLSGLLFPHQAGGSLVTADGKAVGAKLVGQEFTEAYFMKGRPSAYHYNTYYTDEQGSRFYNDGSEFAGLGSGSNNYAPSNPALTQRVEADIEAFLAENPGVAREDIPADLMTASGSGLDPHISPAAAQVQLPAIAEASGLSPERLAQIVADNTEEKLLGVFGEETVNVLGVNLDIALAMGLMMQESFVFTGTVMDNLRYGNLAAGDEELIRAAELVCADGFIRALPHGYDTVLTEGGAMLSQGEKQLLALARTMASDPKILILDEATSSVDTKTERELQEGVNRMLKGRTSFIVAHRLSTIRACNKIMYIDHGEIAECGTHEELLARKGLYWQLCQEI